jgi:hypothetical protein
MSEVVGSEYEAVVDVRGGGALRRAGDLAVGVASALLGDSTAGTAADIVVRRRDDHRNELFRLEDFEEDEAAQLVREVREDLDRLPLEEFRARWGPGQAEDS